jgi:microcystin-dependent protein
MSQPFVGEIRSVGFNFAPEGWLLCDGSVLSISQNEVLFDLIGTTYGGDGQNTFAIPDLRGRIPLHQGTGGGSSYVIGQEGGSESVTLTEAQMPAHRHAINAVSTTGNSKTPSGAYFAASVEEQFASSTNASLNSTIVQAAAGGSQPHENRVPILCINYIISLYGIFPSQN